jgi:NDP-sugar pyrophosphorylase family protein
VKVVILAGGLGTRLAEETKVRPKPMVEIGGRPILWHILKIYYHHGYRDFVIALGYKGEHIKRWLVEYCSYNGNLTLSSKDGRSSAMPAPSTRTGPSSWSTPASRPPPAAASSASRRTWATSRS